MGERICSVEGCGRPHSCRGFCRRHYTQARVAGTIATTPYAERFAPPIERFLSNIAITDECWEWTASTTNRGYAQFKADSKNRLAHRFSYELFIGPIPDGMTIDHLCRNRRCVNPDHLEAVTARENVLRGVGLSAENARKTHCVHGHEFTPENTYWAKARYGVGRQCRECHRLSEQRRRELRT